MQTRLSKQGSLRLREEEEKFVNGRFYNWVSWGAVVILIFISLWLIGATLQQL